MVYIIYDIIFNVSKILRSLDIEKDDEWSKVLKQIKLLHHTVNSIYPGAAIYSFKLGKPIGKNRGKKNWFHAPNA